MNLMNCLVLETNGFMMNAGILGFIRLLTHAQAVKGMDYDYNDYQLLIDKDYLRSLDLAQAYIETANELFYETTHHARFMRALESVSFYQDWLDREETWTKEESAQIKKHLSDIITTLEALVVTKSLSNACYWLQNEGLIEEDLPALVKEAKKATDYTVKIAKLLEIQAILRVPKVKEILSLVGVSLRVLSQFWLNKAFILNKQGNIVISSDQNMKKLLEETIVNPFKEQLDDLPLTDKVCSECGCALPKKSKYANLSFMNHIADDIAKKPSAFWNFDKNQALLCDHCTFVYLLMPLGFTSMGRELVFVNSNSTISSLVLTNAAKLQVEAEVSFNWTTLCQQLVMRCVEKQVVQSDNIQLVIRTTDKGKQRYRFEVLSYEALRVIEANQNLLTGLSKCYALKLSSGDYWNVCEEVIVHLLNHAHLYPILHRLLRLSLSSEYEVSAQIQLPLVYKIQLSKRQIQLEGDEFMKSKQLYFATQHAMKDGKALHHHLTHVSKKGIESVMYRLLNAIQTNNRHEFLNTVLRLHTSYGVQLSSDFIKLLNEPTFFKDMGYAYLLGLKGLSTFKDNRESEAETTAVKNEEGVLSHE